MKKITLSLILVLFLQSALHAAWAKRTTIFNEINSEFLYEDIVFEEAKPNEDALFYGTLGYNYLKEQGKINNNKLTIVDFSISANQERFWVIDMDSREVIYHTLVSHGKNSGQEYASAFSNNDGSHMSSLGFYLTESIYDGKHKKSLRLDGLESGFNSNARQRGVVIHAADYVSHDYVRNNGRLGRSHGCPALPNHLNDEIVETIQNQSCLFLYYPDNDYINYSPILNEIISN